MPACFSFLLRRGTIRRPPPPLKCIVGDFPSADDERRLRGDLLRISRRRGTSWRARCAAPVRDGVEHAARARGLGLVHVNEALGAIGAGGGRAGDGPEQLPSRARHVRGVAKLCLIRAHVERARSAALML